MNAWMFKPAAIGLLGAVLAGSAVQGATNLISGQITNGVVWSGTNLVHGAVVIASNVVATIQPGTLMLMSTGAVLRVHGRLLADGTAAEPIRFTRATAGLRWGRLLFSQAAPSRLRHCVIEFADCVGDHKAYYDNDCNAATPLPSRTYFQAVVAVASHLDLEGCVFRNLPDGALSSDRSADRGDALAIIADDPDIPGTASATVRNCQFLSIGQGVHTRFAYVLVENCFFTDHRGDNDDVDLYGESLPPPLVRSNLFVKGHDDYVNPTRCSAVIEGNLFLGDRSSGGTDSGVVLRDRGSPVMINNLIVDCPSSGISVQNTCAALLLNNTIVNCGSGINLRNHTSRLGPPYCLTPGSGRVFLTNCILWGCSRVFDFESSGSDVALAYSDVQGGQSGISVPSGSTFRWGAGNLNATPQFVNPAATNYGLQATSPCLDSGASVSVVITITNLAGLVTNLTVAVTNDLNGLPRPLDGDGDTVARLDIGAYEFDLRTVVSTNWFLRHGLDAADPYVPGQDPDNDTFTTFQEWVADTDPTNALSFFRIETVAPGPPVKVEFLSSSNRVYTLWAATNLTSGNWTSVAGQSNLPGTGAVVSLGDTNAGPERFYRVGVRTP